MPVLERKMLGGTMIIAKVVSFRADKSALGVQWLTKERMIQWLDHVDIFNHFFSGSVH
jgi:hypothetical protein